MSERVDEERAEAAFEQRIERGKQVLRDAQEVLRAYVAGERVSETARRLGMTRHRVHHLQRFLKLRDGRTGDWWSRRGGLVEAEAC